MNGHFEIASERGPCIILKFWDEEGRDDIESLLHETPGSDYRLLDHEGVLVRHVIVGKHIGR